MGETFTEDDIKDMKDSMGETQDWTSMDLYYKGVHVKKSISIAIKANALKDIIDIYLDAGFLPSWNAETNGKALQEPKVETPIPPTTVPTVAIPICPIHNKEMIKRTGKYGEFWSCPTKDAQDNWCKYKPEIK